MRIFPHTRHPLFSASPAQAHGEGIWIDRLASAHGSRRAPNDSAIGVGMDELAEPAGDGPRSPLLSRSVTTSGDVNLVSLAGELDLSTAVGLLDWLVGVAGSKMVIDLSELTFMDSSGIAVFIQAKNELGDSVVLTRPQPNVKRVFEVTGLSDLCTAWDPGWASPSPDSSLGRD
jgi:anti-sigma B factor antagonist